MESGNPFLKSVWLEKLREEATGLIEGSLSKTTYALSTSNNFFPYLFSGLFATSLRAKKPLFLGKIACNGISLC